MKHRHSIGSHAFDLMMWRKYFNGKEEHQHVFKERQGPLKKHGLSSHARLVCGDDPG
jgi:hypothetical protein